MPSILFVSCDPPNAAVTRYRCTHFADILRAAGWQADVVYVGDPRVRVAHDIVVLHRICTVAEGRAFAHAARAIGATLVYGTDDLVFDQTLFDTTDPHQAHLAKFAPLHREMLQSADAVIVSTDYLADRVRPISNGKPVITLRNFLSDDLLRLSQTAVEAVKSENNYGLQLGYLSGTPTHDADLARIAAPLRTVLQNHPHVRLLLAGNVKLPEPLVDLQMQIIRQPFVPYTDLPQIIARLAVNLAPLETGRPFNHAKSEIKILEAMACGVPTVASPAAGMREAVTNSRDALFAESEIQWTAILERLIVDSAARKTAAEQASAYLITNGTAWANTETVIAAFTALLPVSRDRSAVRRVNWLLAPKYLVKRLLGR